MRTINIHEANTHLSRQVDQVVAGEPFIIAKAGKPMVKVVPLDAPASTDMRGLGFMQGQGAVPDDFDEIAREEIEQLFAGGE
jgi:prevent-host-death family protein